MKILIKFICLFLLGTLFYIYNPEQVQSAESPTINTNLQKNGVNLFYTSKQMGETPIYLLNITNNMTFDVFKITDILLDNSKPTKAASIWIYNNKFSTEEFKNTSDRWCPAAKHKPVYMVNALGRFTNSNGKIIGQDIIYKFEENQTISSICYERGEFSNWKWQKCYNQLNLQNIIY